jgi:lipopolysaccharide transport system permease protein
MMKLFINQQATSTTAPNWKEIWQFRELMYMLTWRDIKVRYKQTAIGITWSVLKPLITTLLFTLVFSRITKFQNPSSAPYILMVFAGMIPWQFFSVTLNEISQSLVGNAGLVNKIYFPKIILPFSTILTNLIDFFISMLIMAGMMWWFHYTPGWQVMLLPFFILLLVACALGTGLYLSVLNVKFRDFKFIIPFILQIGLFITPIAFSSTNISDHWRLVYALNPMVGIISGARWCLLNDPIYWPEVVMSCVLTSVMLGIGMRYFTKMEKTFADSI